MDSKLETEKPHYFSRPNGSHVTEMCLDLQGSAEYEILHEVA